VGAGRVPEPKPFREIQMGWMNGLVYVVSTIVGAQTRAYDYLGVVVGIKAARNFAWSRQVSGESRYDGVR
jgi:hypothetical protein